MKSTVCLTTSIMATTEIYSYVCPRWCSPVHVLAWWRKSCDWSYGGTNENGWWMQGCLQRAKGMPCPWLGVSDSWCRCASLCLWCTFFILMIVRWLCCGRKLSVIFHSCGLVPVDFIHTFQNFTSTGTIIQIFSFPWWRHQMETFSALLALCAGNSPVTGEFPAQRSVTRSFDIFYDLCLNNRLRNNRKAGDLRRPRAHYMYQ